MASVSVSHMIIFIASMVIAASVAGVFADSVGQLSNAISEQGVDVSQDVRTDVEIISDSGSDAIYNASGDENITIYVKNTGSETLPIEARHVDLFVDGQYETAVTSTLQGDGDTWRPGQVVRLDIDHPLSDGDHRVKVVVNGDEEVFQFRS